MSLAAANASSFVAEASNGGSVWAIRDSGGYPTSTNSAGEMAMPFWSTESRAKKIIEGVAAYRDFEPIEIKLEDFVERWIPGLERDGLFVGLNWYGDRAVGYNFTPEQVRTRLGLAKS